MSRQEQWDKLCQAWGQLTLNKKDMTAIKDAYLTDALTLDLLRLHCRYPAMCYDIWIYYHMGIEPFSTEILPYHLHDVDAMIEYLQSLG